MNLNRANAEWCQSSLGISFDCAAVFDTINYTFRLDAWTRVAGIASRWLASYFTDIIVPVKLIYSVIFFSLTTCYVCLSATKPTARNSSYMLNNNKKKILIMVIHQCYESELFKWIETFKGRIILWLELLTYSELQYYLLDSKCD